MAVSKQCKEILCLLYACILFVSGAVLIVFSVYFGYKLVFHFKFVQSQCIGPFIVIFILAFAHIFLTWLGIKGPRKEHMFHLIMFIGITLLLILLEVAIGVWSMILWSKVADKSLQLMTNSFEGFVKDNYDKSDWVKLQNKLQCCGINSESDYSTIGSPLGSIPISCCNSTTPNSCPTIFQRGCKDPLINYVKELMMKVAWIGFGCGLAQILGIVCFYYFYKTIKAEVTARDALRKARRAQEVNPVSPLSRPSSRFDPNNRESSGTPA